MAKSRHGQYTVSMEAQKHDWKKSEKTLYAPGAKPLEVSVPAMGFFLVDGQGSPDDPAFEQAVAALYALAYAVRMSAKNGTQPPGYFEFSVYPLEGIWSLGGASLEAASLAYREKRPAPAFDRKDLIYTLMIRQPDFVQADYADQVIERVKAKKSLPTLAAARFQVEAASRCVQMLHGGPYTDEPASFRLMEEFCRQASLARVGHDHREIYLSDARKVAPEKLKTILRFPVRDDFRCL